MTSERAGLIRQAATAVAEGLGAFLASIVNGIKALVPAFLLVGTGCQGGEGPTTMPDPPGTVVVRQATPADAGVAPPVDSGPRSIGAFTITFYYVIGEEEVVPAARAVAKAAPANDNQLGMAPSAVANDEAPTDSDDLAAVAPPPAVATLYTDRCESIADVAPEFAAELRIQGTGKLRDGRVVNISGPCRCAASPCYSVTANQWGTAGTGRPLQPFRTVAVDPKVVKLGSLLYVPLLEGRTMPGRAPWGGYVHDGCVVADDTGGGIDGHQLDLFVGRKAYFLGLSGSEGSHSWARHVPVYDGSEICTRRGREIRRKVGAI